MTPDLWTPRPRRSQDRVELAPMGFGLALARAPKILGGIKDPTVIAGLQFWARADLGFSIGANVAWNDQSGTGDTHKNLAQATTTGWTRTTSDSSYNNQSTITVGTKPVHSTAWSSALTQPFTVFIVGNYDGTNANELYIDDATGGSRIIIDENGPALGQNGLFPGSGYLGVARTSNTAPKILCGIFNGASSKLFVSSLTAGGTGGSGKNNLASMSIGGSFADTAVLVGKIAEVIVYQGSLSTIDRTSVMNYLSGRYAITVSP